MRILSINRLIGWTLLGSLFLTGVPGAAQGTGSGAPAPKGNVDNGKKLFNDVGCWQCHGYSGQGGAGAKIAPDPISYPNFSRYVRKPAGQMPPYSPKVLSDAELADIYSFLQSIPKAPDADSIPILQSEKKD